MFLFPREDSKWIRKKFVCSLAPLQSVLDPLLQTSCQHTFLKVLYFQEGRGGEVKGGRKTRSGWNTMPTCNCQIPSSALWSHSTIFFICSRKTVFPFWEYPPLYHLMMVSSLRTSAKKSGRKRFLEMPNIGIWAVNGELTLYDILDLGFSHLVLKLCSKLASLLSSGVFFSN